MSEASAEQRRFRLWPRSLIGQVCAAVAIALLAAQLFNAVLLYRGQQVQRDVQLVNALGVRIVTTTERLNEARERRAVRMRRRGFTEEEIADENEQFPRFRRRAFRRGITLEDNPPDIAEMELQPTLTKRLSDLLDGYEIAHAKLAVYYDDRPRLPPADAIAPPMLSDTGRVMAVLQRPDGQWLATRVPAPPSIWRITGWLIVQTLLLYIVLLATIIFVARRITRPLAQLTEGVRDFGDTQRHEPIAPSGPDDVAGLTEAFNRMSSRIGAMLDEKDVMLGAIGHDLKTPLAALRVRVESVQDEKLRTRMVASIDDLNRSLEDMLALARIGHDVQPPQPVNIAALLDTIADEFSDLGKDVELVNVSRLVAPVHITWMRRAVRNLVSNAVRYGERARVYLHLEGKEAIIRIDDDGPGIPEEELPHIFNAFYRLEKSRNTVTGGTGLGLTLARAIAEQHKGALTLNNRIDQSGVIIGLSAELRFSVS
ncbi:sensor histidine kinase [Alterisphingorhabdus coralli]|uniref:histidine kinase n=1 Tax=Alterisphingorhabdus coralli TaxID=3071408 RepID=A0AA97F6I7_9SPHN|nr:ATP-binding protein [Parasphingorhabdus sp. SCSIO 66989]WOE75116.1 ATP-binding protein [Parasphingorhabdus sp. SCSIO 66989]